MDLWTERMKKHQKWIKPCIGLLCLLMTVVMLAVFVRGNGKYGEGTQKSTVNYEIMNRYDSFMSQKVSDALDGVLAIKKSYWLSDQDLVAPEPNQSCYGETTDPSSLQWLLDDAQELMDGQQTLFRTDVEIPKDSKVYYYLDETILVITWKQIIDRSVYTMSEVKIADPSQFRRFLADGEFGSYKKYVTTEMASSVNAVVAINGDFYAFRNMGIIVQDSQLMRMEGRHMDTCFIDGNGDLQFAYANQMTDQQQVEKYIKDHGVRFSIAFGPVLVDDGKVRKLPDSYPVGEGNVFDSRSALGQLDTLHYVLVTVNPEYTCKHGQPLWIFAENLQELGCIKAYNLDGGQSSTLVMNDKLMNNTFQRLISDILYFATAVPNGE